jgi:hypothetical protein
VPALDGALSFAQVDDVPVGVAKQLHLDVTGILHQPFQVDRIVTEGGLSLTPGDGNGILQFCP